MECFLVVVVLAVFVIVSLIAERAQRSRRINYDFRVFNQGPRREVLRRELGEDRFVQLKRGFEQVAKEYAGNLVAGIVPQSPQVVFHHRGTRVLLSLQDTLRAASRLREEIARFYTRLTFKVPQGWRHRLEIYPQSSEIDAQFLKMYDIEIGAPEFDPKYVIKASEAEFATRFLDAAAREAIDALCEMPPVIGIILSLNRERMILSKPSVMSDPRMLGRFISQGSAIYGRIEALMDEAAGLHVVEASVAVSENPLCNVCGMDITPDLRVRCRRCETPMHRDCWRYNKKCAVFGCGCADSLSD
jgi:hypothetical protein